MHKIEKAIYLVDYNCTFTTLKKRLKTYFLNNEHFTETESI